MLARFGRFSVRNLAHPSLRRFGGGGGPTIPVHLDKKQNWIDNKDFDKDLVNIFGWKDAHDHHHEDHTDPYSHVRGKPLISFERMYFTDPYHGTDEGEPLMNEPHGYLTGDDPLDTRNSIERAIPEYYVYFFVGVCFALTLGYNYMNLAYPTSTLFNLNLTANLLEEELRKKRQENKALEDRRDQLRAQLEGSQ